MTYSSQAAGRPARHAALGAVAAFVTLGSALGAQTIAQRVGRVRDGIVRLSFATRPDLCGRGTTIHRGPNNTTNWGDYRRSADVEWDASCEYGPGRVVLDVREGEIVALRFYVGGRWRAADSRVTDLGTVRARDAAEYLVSLAATLPGKPGREAIFPATTADSADVGPGLLAVARDERRPRQTRKDAIFWLGQMAGEAINARLESIATSDDDRDIGKSAVFALSQRPRDEGVPILIRIARTHRYREIRKDALFWLGQSEDPRAIALFEEILVKK